MLHGCRLVQVPVLVLFSLVGINLGRSCHRGEEGSGQIIANAVPYGRSLGKQLDRSASRGNPMTSLALRSLRPEDQIELPTVPILDCNS